MRKSDAFHVPEPDLELKLVLFDAISLVLGSKYIPANLGECQRERGIASTKMLNLYHGPGCCFSSWCCCLCPEQPSQINHWDISLLMNAQPATPGKNSCSPSIPAHISTCCCRDPAPGREPGVAWNSLGQEFNIWQRVLG